MLMTNIALGKPTSEYAARQALRLWYERITPGEIVGESVRWESSFREWYRLEGWIGRLRGLPLEVGNYPRIPLE